MLENANNAYVGETEDTFLAPHTCTASLRTNQRPGVGSIDQSEAGTESSACGGAGVTNSLAGISWEAPPAPAPAVAGDSRKLTT